MLLKNYYAIVLSFNLLFLDPRRWPEVSYELASVCPSILLPSRSFLGIGSLVFSETQHGVRGLCGFVRDRARFFEEKKIVPNMVKLG